MKSSEKIPTTSKPNKLDITQIKGRKTQHVKISLTKDVQAQQIQTGFEDIHFIHRALPEIDYDAIDTRITLFGKQLDLPIIISAMTGGNTTVTQINGQLAEIAAKFGLGMGVGSQRAAVEDSSLIDSYRITRENAPDNLLIGNIGAGQLAMGWGVTEINQAIQMIDADVLAIHLNPLHEVIQPEGECNYQGVLKQLASITPKIDCPIIVKETGAGICAEDAQQLVKTGIAGIDVAGAGGTSFAAVETYRAQGADDHMKEHLGKLFWDWGIPTAISTIELCNTTKLPIISSGGIRDGIAIAKALALGASATGLAIPFLQHAGDKEPHNLTKYVERLIHELKTTMFLVGAETIQDLRKTDLVITGFTNEWIKQRGIDPTTYAHRSQMA